MYIVQGRIQKKNEPPQKKKDKPDFPDFPDFQEKFPRLIVFSQSRFYNFFFKYGNMFRSISELVSMTRS